MAMKNFEVKGTCLIGDSWQPFTKVVSAPNEGVAREHILADIGSKHRLKRNYISIKGVTVVGE